MDVAPDVALPWVAREHLLAMPNSRRWWLVHGDATALLHALAGGFDANTIELDLKLPEARSWLRRLPIGAALTTAEGRTLDKVRPHVTEPDVLRELFHVRFGVPPPDTYDRDHMNALYAVVSRLPAAHLQQQRVHAIKTEKLEPGTIGEWGNDDVKLSPELAPGAQSKTVHPKDGSGWLTAEDMRAMYGFDEVTLRAKVKSGEVQQFFGAEKYRMAEGTADQFAFTVLHEFGHAVDELLGGRTPPVWDFAGWHEHSTFDAWASEMGGWERVSARDRDEIHKAIIDAAKTKIAVAELAPSDHPARSSRYADVGLVSLIRGGANFAYQHRVEHEGRVFSMLAENRMFSLDAKAAATAPSDYSLKTPAEYFAECYAEYYYADAREPGAPKGGKLPLPVKDWFTRQVDTLRYDPRRVKVGAAGKP